MLKICRFCGRDQTGPFPVCCTSAIKDEDQKWLFNRKRKEIA